MMSYDFFSSLEPDYKIHKHSGLIYPEHQTLFIALVTLINNNNIIQFTK